MHGRNSRRYVIVASLALAALAPLTAGCWDILLAFLPDTTPPQNLAPTITAAEAKAIIDLEDPNVTVMDIRRPFEYMEERIEGSVNLCLICSLNFDDELAPFDKTKTYIVYGSANDFRSARASDRMVELGFEDVRHMNGGLEEWKEEGYPTVSD
ncbi:MAG: rhodanese-like domain-containing protein [Phycisphaerae bacterium]|nr:rhodanese-like domain-containing protein [Phycisphaerae bacterium]